MGIKEELDKLDHKQPGYLIRHDDWNALVDTIQALYDELNTAITEQAKKLQEQCSALQSVDAELKDQLGKLETRLTKVEQDLKNHLAVKTYRIALKADASGYVFGDVAGITATVTDGEGAPQAGMTVDFVTTWGAFKDSGGRAISMPTDNTGKAMIGLYAAEFADQSRPYLIDPVSDKVPRADILNAGLPEDLVSNIFGFLSTEYEEPGTAVRQDMDNYYQKLVAQGSFSAWEKKKRGFQNHIFTVTAYLKCPAGQTRSEPCAIATLQLTFRDWAGAWIDYYIDKPEPDPIKDFFQPKTEWTFAKEYVSDWQKKIAGIVENEGLVGKLRQYKIVADVLADFQRDDTLAQHPAFREAVGYTLNAVHLQQNLELAQHQTAGFEPDRNPAVAVAAFVDIAGRNQTVESAMQEMRESVNAMKGDFDTISQNLATYEGAFVRQEKLETLVRENGSKWLAGAFATTNEVDSRLRETVGDIIRQSGSAWQRNLLDVVDNTEFQTKLQTVVTTKAQEWLGKTFITAGMAQELLNSEVQKVAVPRVEFEARVAIWDSQSAEFDTIKESFKGVRKQWEEVQPRLNEIDTISTHAAKAQVLWTLVGPKGSRADFDALGDKIYNNTP